MSFAAADEIELSVNGRTARLPVRRTWMLADLLRSGLGLTGTKVSCDMQVCGACTVTVDERPVSACTYLALDAAGRDVRTVEGLADESGRLSDVQQAFVDHFALQCGFCTPGFLMTATALLAENPDPTAEEVREYLDGNICRCSGYRPIVAAIMAVAAERRQARDVA